MAPTHKRWVLKRCVENGFMGSGWRVMQRRSRRRGWVRHRRGLIRRAGCAGSRRPRFQVSTRDDPFLIGWDQCHWPFRWSDPAGSADHELWKEKSLESRFVLPTVSLSPLMGMRPRRGPRYLRLLGQGHRSSGGAIPPGALTMGSGRKSRWKAVSSSQRRLFRLPWTCGLGEARATCQWQHIRLSWACCLGEAALPVSWTKGIGSSGGAIPPGALTMSSETRSCWKVASSCQRHLIRLPWT